MGVGMALGWALVVAAWATVCETEATGTMSCDASGLGRISAVIDNFYEYDGLAGYACSALSHTGPERVTEFSCDYLTDVTVTMSQTECDVDLIVLDDTCAPGAGCEAWNTAVYDAVAGTSGAYPVSFVCLPGRTYYLVVEARSRSGGTTCPSLWRDVDGDGVQDAVEVGRGSRFRLERVCDESCDDGGDNDADGLADCVDPDCAGTATCCDADRDGALRPGGSCLGDDCDDADALRAPGLEDLPADGLDADCDGVDLCWSDADGDGWGAGDAAPGGDLDCTDPGEAVRGGDCDDGAPGVRPGAAEVAGDGVDQDCDGVDHCFEDRDGDGFGGGAAQAGPGPTCAAAGWAGRGGDCADGVGGRYPGAPEVPGDGVDQDCDGVDHCYVDADLDGVGAGAAAPGPGPACTAGYAGVTGDCDDGEPTVRPGGVERCGGGDEDCDASVDEAGAVGEIGWYLDGDGDGYGAGAAVPACAAPAGRVALAGDCDDGAAAVRPGAVEVCDGADNDCDGLQDDADPGLSAGVSGWTDGDGDGWGDGSQPVSLVRCELPPGVAGRAGDCADGDAQRYPGRPEVAGDGVDQDCDGLDHCYADADGDGWGAGAASPGAAVCTGAWAAVDGDCAASVPEIHPGADEACNGEDDDCDGRVDDDDTLDVDRTAFLDGDGDGFGDGARPVTLAVCALPPGHAWAAGDCDDAAGAVYPGAAEQPYDGVDQDCDGADVVDVDGDGVAGGPGGSDCDDTSTDVRPGAVELADGVDQDCDGAVDDGTEWADDDGDGFAEAGGDCDDARTDRRPGVEELCDGLDGDCDGVVDEGAACFDDDGDGLSEADGDCHDGDATVRPGAAPRPGVDAACEGRVPGGDGDGDGWTVAGGDCDDSDPGVRPGVPERADGVDEDCDGRVDDGTEAADDDGDGWSEAQGDCHDGEPAVSPGAAEQGTNGRDDDCDGAVDEGGPRVDGDGDGVTPEAGDCADDDAAVRPGALERGNGVDDDCDGAVDEPVTDRDADGYTEAQGDCDDAQGWMSPGMAEVCDGLDNDCDAAVDEGCTARDDDSEVEETDAARGCTLAGGGVTWLGGLVLLALRRRDRPVGLSVIRARALRIGLAGPPPS